MSSSNPALNDKVFQREIAANNEGSFTPGWGAPGGQGTQVPPPMGMGGPMAAPGTGVGGPAYAEPGDTMRLGGTLSATAILLLLLIVAGVFGWNAVEVGPEIRQINGSVTRSFAMPAWLIASWIGGFVLAIVTIFKPKLARVTAPLYSLAQGLLVGAISRAYEVQFDGIVLQAVGLTVGVFVIMLVLFATGTVKVTERMRTMIIAATGAIMLVYLATIVLRIFGSDVPMIHESGPIGIGFSLLVVGIASMNLLLDFDFIQRGVAMRAPRYMEWFAAFGLMVTLIWLYLELLRLLSKLRSR